MKKAATFVWYWLVAMPIWILFTLFTSIFTILLFPWKNSEFVHKEQQLWSKMFFWLSFASVEVTGTENLQKGQSYVFVANHTSLFDSWIVYGYLPVIFKWMMKAEIRKIPLVGTACHAAGHIFVDRVHPKAAMQSIRQAKESLKDGVSVVIFPEGTRSTDGKVHDFKRGAFQIAFDLELPVVPLSLVGPFELYPRGAKLIKPGVRCKLVVGKPVDIRPYILDKSVNVQDRRAKQEEMMALLKAQIEDGMKA